MDKFANHCDSSPEVCQECQVCQEHGRVAILYYPPTECMPFNTTTTTDCDGRNAVLYYPPTECVLPDTSTDCDDCNKLVTTSKYSSNRNIKHKKDIISSSSRNIKHKKDIISSIRYNNEHKKDIRVKKHKKRKIRRQLVEETSSPNTILNVMLSASKMDDSSALIVSSGPDIENLISSLSSSPSTREVIAKDNLSQLLPSHLTSTSPSKEVSSKISVDDSPIFIKNFQVSFDTKQGHQWATYNKTLISIHINDKNGPILHLYRGMTYYFHINSSNKEGEPLYNALMFTTSPCGGRNALPIPGGFNPIAQGMVCFRVTNETPRYFFYQNFYEEFQGGLVIIHD